MYNNSGDKSVTHTLISASSAGLSNWISDGRVLRVTYTGSCTWGNGLVQSISTSANKVFYTMIYAKVPVGYTLEPAYNASGDGATRTWITSNQKGLATGRHMLCAGIVAQLVVLVRLVFGIFKGMQARHQNQSIWT